MNGESAHSTQKPLALLYRVLLASTNPDDVVLDPFFGTGTTGAAAKILNRNWIGIESDKRYVEIAQKRIADTISEEYNPELFDLKDEKRLAPRVPFSRLVESGYIKPGGSIYFEQDPKQAAKIQANGLLSFEGFQGSIHQTTKHILKGKPANGWLYWYVKNKNGGYICIDQIREEYRKDQQEAENSPQDKL